MPTTHHIKDAFPSSFFFKIFLFIFNTITTLSNFLKSTFTKKMLFTISMFFSCFCVCVFYFFLRKRPSSQVDNTTTTKKSIWRPYVFPCIILLSTSAVLAPTYEVVMVITVVAAQPQLHLQAFCSHSKKAFVLTDFWCLLPANKIFLVKKKKVSRASETEQRPGKKCWNVYLFEVFIKL